MSSTHKLFLYILWSAFFAYLVFQFAPKIIDLNKITKVSNLVASKIKSTSNSVVRVDNWQEADRLNEKGLAVQNTDPKAAENFFRQAIEKDPAYYFAYNNLGILYSDSHRQEEAYAMYAKAIQVKPDYAKAYNNLGVWYYESGDKNKAMEMYKKTITFNQTDPNPFGNIALILDVEMGKTEEAIPYYKKAIEYGSKNTLVIQRFKEIGL